MIHRRIWNKGYFPVIFLVILGMMESGFTPALPANVVAAIVIKIAQYDRSLDALHRPVSIFVMGDEDLALHLREHIGRKVTTGFSLVRVESGKHMPLDKPDILVIGSAYPSSLECLKYTRANRILSIATDPESIVCGATIGLILNGEGKADIFFNAASSAAEGCEWSSPFFRVVKTVN